MKGFDGQFVLKWMLEQGLQPKVIPNGSKLMSIEVKSLNIRIIDSFNFLPMSLAKLPATFGLRELKKGYFPHFFNTPENQYYVGPIPDPQFYNPDAMSTAERQKFYSWYEERKAEPFDFRKEMLEYCRSDVDILRRCCIDFREQFLNCAQIDPFQYVTIASVAMAIYRAHHIPPNSIAAIPPGGYITNSNFSLESIRWLDFVSQQENVAIAHAMNGHGEKKLMGASVDGFCEATQTAYQYHGCFFHGCPICYDATTFNPVLQKPMGALYERTQKRSAEIRERFVLVEIWEHDFKQL
ncbi:hypothetical protein JTE90_016151 [Oedothorax gibbosus]|uniref:DNA-directed DNA polymerase n=1 Tax=Oedothorax gibbosus TaxID=931172 RepID=A0AAV6TMF9_9ARAC|nr:hypothetical protein JTE90_016151 [Oedothorax gibbosus]